MIHSSGFCLVIVVHESLVCPEILQGPQILWSCSIFVYLNPFQQWLYDFEVYLFTPKTTEGLLCNYYRRFKHSLMLQKEKPFIKSRAWKLVNRIEMCTFFLFCLNIIFFPFSTSLQSLQKIVMCPRRPNKLNLPWSSNSKRFHPVSCCALDQFVQSQGIEPVICALQDPCFIALSCAMHSEGENYNLTFFQ